MGDNAVIENPNADKISNTGENQTKPNVVKKGGIELQIERYPLSRYEVNNEAADGKIKGIGVGMSNILFGVNHIVVTGVDTALAKLSSLDPINQFADKMANVSKHTFTTLKNEFAPLLWVWFIAYVGYILLVKNNLRDSGKRFMLFLLVMVIGSWYATNAGEIVKATNKVSADGQAKLLVMTSDLLQMDKGKKDSVYGKGSQIKTGEEVEGTTTLLRNIYFDLALKKPYLIANYGTTNESAINQKANAKKEKETDKKGAKNKTYSRIDKLLSYKLNEAGDEDRQKYVKNIEVKKYDNEKMATGNVWNQVGFAAIAPIASIALAIPFLGVAVMNFLIQFAIVLLIFVIVFMFMISLVPRYATTGFKGIGYLMGAFIMKMVMFLLIALLYVISYMVDTLVPPNNMGLYLVNVILLCIILFWIVMKRNKIVSLLTAGKVKQVDRNIVQNTRDNVVKPMVKTVKPMAKGATWAGQKVYEGGRALDRKFGAPMRDKMRANVERRKQQKQEREQAEKSPNVVPMKDFRTRQASGNTPSKKPNTSDTSSNPNTRASQPSVPSAEERKQSTNQQTTKPTAKTPTRTTRNANEKTRTPQSSPNNEHKDNRSKTPSPSPKKPREDIRTLQSVQKDRDDKKDDVE